MELLFAALVTFIAVGVLAATVCESLRRRRRANALGRYAHGQRMRFAAEDHLDLPNRYRQFALMQCGHDLTAENLCDRRSTIGRARTFDLRCDVGRGYRRAGRRYAVAAVELADDVEPPKSCPSARGGEVGGVERIGRTLLGCVPMGDAPQDHAEALDRVLGALVAPGGDEK